MMPNFKYLCVLTALVLWVCALPSRAADDTPDSARAKAKLAEIRDRISALTERRGADLKQRDALRARLRAADLGITAARRRLEGLHAAELAAEGRRVELKAEAARVQRQLAEERSALAAQARAAYMNGREEQIKLLLNQDDPASAGRMQAYYGYFARERSAKIAAIDAQVSKVRELGTELEQTAAALQALQGDSAREMANLQRVREERAAALVTVTQSLDKGAEELGSLKHEEQAEEALIADLAEVLQDYPIDARENFAALRGRLAWPVTGRLAARYGESRANAAAGLRWNGVLIETRRGAKVRAPYYGRVVYADWLQGLGLLLIIGHGGNYMTLYGHAEVLYKSVGDWVAPGDVIAGVSDSVAAPQLYFEIREGRKTLDPAGWLKAAP